METLTGQDLTMINSRVFWLREREKLKRHERICNVIAIVGIFGTAAYAVFFAYAACHGMIK